MAFSVFLIEESGVLASTQTPPPSIRAVACCLTPCFPETESERLPTIYKLFYGAFKAILPVDGRPPGRQLFSACMPFLDEAPCDRGS